MEIYINYIREINDYLLDLKNKRDNIYKRINVDKTLADLSNDTIKKNKLITEWVECTCNYMDHSTPIIKELVILKEFI
jgi:hypothetical protein